MRDFLKLLQERYSILEKEEDNEENKIRKDEINNCILWAMDYILRNDL